MAFSIDEFKSHLNDVGDLPVNKYFVSIPLPKVIRAGAFMVDSSTQMDLVQVGKMIEFGAEEAHIPGVQAQTTQVQRYGIGPLQKSPTNAIFSDVPLTFRCDRKSILYSFFYQWMNCVFTFDETDFSGQIDTTTYRVSYRDDFAVNLDIMVYDAFGNPSMVVRLLDAYPVALNEISLGWKSNNEIMRLSSTITFRDWQIVNSIREVRFSTAVQGLGTVSIPPRPLYNAALFN